VRSSLSLRVGASRETCDGGARGHSLCWRHISVPDAGILRSPRIGRSSLPANPLPKPNLNSAERREIALQGGMMGGGMGMMASMPMMGSMCAAIWTINGTSMTGDDQPNLPPLLTLRRGQSCVAMLRNETA
jgi:hypothetical protein